jgi:hypothetical protein
MHVHVNIRFRRAIQEEIRVSKVLQKEQFILKHMHNDRTDSVETLLTSEDYKESSGECSGC